MCVLYDKSYNLCPKNPDIKIRCYVLVQPSFVTGKVDILRDWFWNVLTFLSIYFGVTAMVM